MAHAIDAENLLMLVHRIPYPPNKGDKIRSYHLLQHLRQQYTVHLATFIDDENDLQYTDTVAGLCGSSHFSNLNPTLSKIKSLPALLGDQPLSVAYYKNAAFQRWIDQTVEKYKITKIVVFSSAMAQFVKLNADSRCVIDFVDVDSDKWMQYSLKKTWPMNWLYRREARTLLRFERKLAAGSSASLFVSKAEAELFQTLAPESKTKIGYFNNGVDTDYFSPAHAYENPYAPEDKVMVFTGAMDYWPNIDAVQWFASEIFPEILRLYPSAKFYIVGSRPAEAVLQLAKLPGVKVTGSVPDVRPYIAYAELAVAPLRIARGIQNKVLEAMAMSKATVVTHQALEGIDAVTGKELILANQAQEFSASVLSLLNHPEPEIGIAARKKVITRYNWDSNLQAVNAVLGADH